MYIYLPCSHVVKVEEGCYVWWLDYSMTPPLYSTVYLPGKGHVVEVEEGCSVGEHRVGVHSDP